MRLALMGFICLAPALTACAATRHPEPVQAGGVPSVNWTSIGGLLADPRSKAVLERDLPALVGSPKIMQAKGMTLQDISPFSGGAINDAELHKIQADLNTAYAPAGENAGH